MAVKPKRRLAATAASIRPTSPKKAGRREWVGLAVIALPCMLYSMDLTVLNLAVPALSAELKPSSTELLWIIDIYGFMVAGSLITMGTLGDRIGRRRLLMIGAACFGVASVMAAFSTSAPMLIALRALLGLAGATLAPSTLSLIRNMFPDPRERTTAIGIWVASYSAGAAIGPLIGGALLDHFWWGSVLLINAPVMLLLLAIGPLLLPEFRDPSAGRLDLASAALSLAAVLTAIYGLKHIAQDGVTVGAVVCIVAGVALAFLFMRRQSRLADPLIDLRLFRSSAFNASLATYTLACFAMFGISLFVGQYLQLVLMLSPLEAGLWTVPWALGFVLGSMFTPLVARRVQPAFVVAGGLALATLGFIVLAFTRAVSGLPEIVAGTVLLSLGLAPVITMATDLIVGAAPPERAGAAAAISETSSEFGGALGIALFGSLGAAMYRNAMQIDALPGVPPAALEAVRGTLGAAAAVAAELPPAAGALLLREAREAFVLGLHMTAIVGAVVLAGTALLALAKLRRPHVARSIAERAAAAAIEPK